MNETQTPDLHDEPDLHHDGEDACIGEDVPTVMLTESPVIEPTTPTGMTVFCACGDPIPRTGKRGRPAKTCVVCRETFAEERAAARVTRCVGVLGKGCGRQLPKPKHRGRPPKTCQACRDKVAAAKAARAAAKSLVNA